MLIFINYWMMNRENKQAWTKSLKSGKIEKSIEIREEEKWHEDYE